MSWSLTLCFLILSIAVFHVHYVNYRSLPDLLPKPKLTYERYLESVWRDDINDWGDYIVSVFCHTCEQGFYPSYVHFYVAVQKYQHLQYKQQVFLYVLSPVICCMHLLILDPPVQNTPPLIGSCKMKQAIYKMKNGKTSYSSEVSDEVLKASSDARAKMVSDLINTF